ncbi:MAG: bacillithiol biosynthesis deacetylase BshB1 [Acidobacteriia bacterium]|nr:bacillithiol biosynthesis deacetylase BshB1 [Terriglobia bacterium]
MSSSENSSASSVPSVADILAIAAHRDDAEQTCGGTLLKMAALGHRTAILDLTRGEMGTRGTAADREREAAEAARILKVSWRGALDIPDGRVENTWENRLQVAGIIRVLRPRVVILPYWQGRHPDHYTCSTLGYEACFLAGLAKLDLSAVRADSLSINVGPTDSWPPTTGHSPHRPFKIIYATLYFDIRPTFVVDISEHFQARFEALMAYKSQYSDQQAGAGLFPKHAEIRTRLETMARFYGLLAGVTYAEPFLQKEVGLADDLTAIPVASI